MNTRDKNICKTCGDEGVAWLLSPCPDCKEGKRIKDIGDRITKSMSGKITSLNEAITLTEQKAQKEILEKIETKLILLEDYLDDLIKKTSYQIN